jgi:glycosyltransferase involved in cell wall biosynthesis
MKIAYIVPSLKKRGPITVLSNIINNIIDRVDIIDIYCFDKIKEIDIKGNIYYINMKYRIDFDQYDIIHSHMLRADYYIWKNKGKIKSKTICISTVHQFIFPVLKYSYNYLTALIFSRLWVLFLKKQDHIVFLTKSMQEYYSKEFSKNKLHFIYNGILERSQNAKINQSISERILQAKLNYKIIGSVGLFTKIKGFDQLIKSLEHLNDYFLVLIGDGREMNKLKKLAHSLNVENRVLFAGFQQEPDAYYNLFDVFVLPSRSEGFGLVLLEASSKNLPIVCSDIPSFREIFPHEVCFFQLENVLSLVDAIQECYLKKDSLAISAFKKFRQDFTDIEMANNYLRLYQRLLIENSDKTISVC